MIFHVFKYSWTKVSNVYSGLQDSDDEDLENDIDQQIESMLAPKRTVKEIRAPLGSVPNTAGTGKRIILNLTI